MLHELSINTCLALYAAGILAGSIVVAYRLGQTISRFVKEGINKKANEHAKLGGDGTNHPTLAKDIAEQVQRALETERAAV